MTMRASAPRIHAFTCAVEGKNVINVLTYKPAIFIVYIQLSVRAVNAESVNNRSTTDNPLCTQQLR